MPKHMIAFSDSILNAGTLQALSPVQDSTVTISGSDIFVPDKYNKVIEGACLTATGTVTRAQLRAPSLREWWFPEINPQRVGATFQGSRPVTDWRENPLQLVTNEGLNFFTDAGGDGTTPSSTYGLVVLDSGKVSPSSGKMFSIVGSSVAALNPAAWVDSPLTFDQTLPVGTYDIVGMRAEGTGLVAARLLFIGASAVTRPGVIGVADSNVGRITDDRYGMGGILGTFSSITPPSVQCLGETGTAQTYVFDLIKRG